MPGTVVSRARADNYLLRAIWLCLLWAVRAHAATFVVSTTADTGVGSLRQAILDANNEPGPDLVTFNIPGAGVHTIAPLTVLPPLLESMVLDATTQPGYAGAPLIELNGASAGNNGGLRLLGGDCTVRGLVINRFGGSGIQIEGGGNNQVQGCRIGTDPGGTVARPNGLEGIWIYNSSGNLVGGTNAADRNLVSGNADSGIYIQNSASNWVAGNFIGTILAGNGALSNRNNGVVLYSARGNLMGGPLPGARNIISANGASGIYVLGAGASDNQIQGNYIGVGVAAGGALANGADGITLSGAGGNLVGGSEPGEGNVISGNIKAGVAITSPKNTIAGNLIGTSGSGSAAVGNGYAGVWVSGCASNLIGGLSDAGRNVISGNRQDGILLSTNCLWNEVSGNWIGLNAAGTAALSNALSGISITSAHSNNIGEVTLQARNVISGNNLYGLYIAGGSTENAIRGNYVGTGPEGSQARPNGRSGIRIESARNVVGPGNVLSGNTLDGVVLAGGGASNNVVQGNLVGSDPSGNTALGNGRGGIGISAAPNNLVGGLSPGSGNVLSGNGDAGVYILDQAASGNTILGNRIGTDAAGVFPLGNRYEGVYLENAGRNQIGSSLPGGANLISANHTRGIYLTNAAWNRIEGNLVGLAADGVSPLPNTFHDLETESGASNNTISSNRLAFAPAPYCGIRIRFGSVNNRLDGNAVFANGALGIDLGNAGVAPNDSCDGDAGANNLQNYPVLSEAFSGAGTVIKGTLNSAPAQSFLIQFFASRTCDASGFGEADLYLGQAGVVTDGSCHASFTALMPGNVPAGWVVTATATDSAGNSSELSACVPVASAPALAFTRTGAALTLSWTNNPAGFVLKQTDSLSPPVWVTVTNSPALANGNWQVTVAPESGERFYRLEFE